MDLTRDNDFSIPEPGQTRYTKFLLTSKDGFEIAVSASAGLVQFSVSPDPDKLDSAPTWFLTQGIGEGLIKVKTDDPAFTLGTMYFVSITNIH